MRGGCVSCSSFPGGKSSAVTGAAVSALTLQQASEPSTAQVLLRQRSLVISNTGVEAASHSFYRR